jgi:hypothetical protein
MILLPRGLPRTVSFVELCVYTLVWPPETEPSGHSNACGDIRLVDANIGVTTRSM